MPRKNDDAVQRRIAFNQQLPCAAPGCPRKRYQVGQWCPRHRDRIRSSGHLNLLCLRPGYYAPEQREAAALFNENPDHPGLKLALKFADHLLRSQGVWSDPKSPSRQIRDHLHANGVTPFQVIVTATALWTFSMRYPQRLPDDLALTMQMGNAICRLVQYAPAPDGRGTHARRPRKLGRQEIGELLRKHVGLFLMNAAMAIIDTATRAVDRKALLAAPFESAPGTTYDLNQDDKKD